MKKNLVFDTYNLRAFKMQDAFSRVEKYRLDNQQIKKVDLNKGIFQETSTFEFDIVLAHITDWIDRKYEKIVNNINCKLLVFYGGGDYEVRRDKIGNRSFLIDRSIIDSDFLTKEEAGQLIAFSDDLVNNIQQLPSFLSSQEEDLISLNNMINQFYVFLHKGEKKEAFRIKSKINKYMKSNGLI